MLLPTEEELNQTIAQLKSYNSIYTSLGDISNITYLAGVLATAKKEERDVTTLAQAIVDEMTDRGVGVGSGDNSGGEASSVNQIAQIERIIEVRNRLPFNSEYITKPFTGIFYDHSGTIEVADQSQHVSLIYAMLVGYFFLQNTSDQDLWFNFGLAAVKASPSIKLSPGESFTMEGNCLFTSNGGVTIIGETQGQTFTNKVIYSGVGTSD